MAKTITIKTELEGTENAAKGISQVSDSAKNASDDLGLMNTGLGKVWKGIEAGGKTAVKTFTNIKYAIAATGIVALIIAITAVVQWFTKTEKGAQTLRVIMAVLGQVVGSLFDVIFKLAGGIKNLFTGFTSFGDFLKTVFNKIWENLINRVKAFGVLFEAVKKLLTGDLKGALKQGADGFIQLSTGITNATDKIQKLGKAIKEEAQSVIDAAKAAAELEKRNNALKVSKRELLVTEEKYRAEINKQSAIAKDQTKDLETRIAALNKQQELETQILNTKIAQAKEEANLIKAKNALSTSSEEDLEAEAQAEANYLKLLAEKEQVIGGIAAERSGLLKEYRDKNISVEQEILTMKQEVEVEKLKSEQERQLKSLENEKEKYVKGLQDRLAKNEINEEKLLQLKTQYEELYQKKKEKIVEEGIKTENEKIVEGIQSRFDQINELDNLDYETKMELLDERYEEEKEKYKDNKEALKAIDEEYIKIKEEADKAFKKKQDDEMEGNKQRAKEVAKEIADFYFQSQIDAVNKQYENKINKLNQSRERELSNTNLTESQKAAINAKYDKKQADLEKKSAKEQAKIKIKQALINGAMAIVQSLANTVLPFPASLAGPALIAVSSGLQIAQIKKEANFRKGGWGNFSGGYTKGPPHELGGIQTPSGEIEGDEYLVSKNTMRSPIGKFIEEANIKQGNVNIPNSGSDDERIAKISSKVTENMMIQNKVIFDDYEYEDLKFNKQVIKNITQN